MAIKFRNYTKQAGITEDYYKVREFFIKLGYAEYTYARWDWMATHGHLDYIGSSQQFYYNIGFRPYATSTIWRKKK